MTEGIVPRSVTVGGVEYVNELQFNDKLGKSFTKAINEAVAGKDWPAVTVNVQRLHELLSTTVEGMSPPVQKGLRAALDNAAKQAEAEDQWSVLEIILSIFALGIPFLVDSVHESSHEHGRRLARAPVDRMDRRPMTAELRACTDSPLCDAFKHLPATGVGVGKVRMLSENREYWARHWSLVGQAKESIDITYFSLERDVYGLALLGHTLSRMRKGVKDVRIMTDAIAGIGGPGGVTVPGFGKDYLDELATAGAKVAIYNPLWTRPFRAGHLGLVASNHDKILTVDGKHAITGGRNIGREYLTQPEDMKAAWRDMDVEIEGERATAALRESVRREFEREDMVSYAGKEVLGNWTRRDIELLGTYLMMDEWMSAPSLSEAEIAALKDDPKKRNALADSLVERAISRLPSEGVTRQPSKSDREFLKQQALELCAYAHLRGSKEAAAKLPMDEATISVLDKTAQSNTGAQDDIGPSLTALVAAAKKRIVIENPYLVMTEGMLEALEVASRNGVEITILTNSPLSTDSDITQAFFLEDFPYILARLPTARIFVATGSRKFHTKSATVDDQVAWFSTYNLDLLSGNINSEVGAALYSRAAATRLRERLDLDMSERRNGFLEYTIKRDPETRQAILRDGKPIVDFGPDNHLSKQVLEYYRKMRRTWTGRRRRFDLFAPLRHSPLRQPAPTAGRRQ